MEVYIQHSARDWYKGQFELDAVAVVQLHFMQFMPGPSVPVGLDVRPLIAGSRCEEVHRLIGEVMMKRGIERREFLQLTVAGGAPFVPDNVTRIKIVGWVVVAWQMLVPLAKYLVGRALVGELTIQGITLRPPIDFNPDALFLGLAILVLAEIFRQASELQREQSLTV